MNSPPIKKNPVSTWIQDIREKPISAYDTTLGEVLVQRGIIKQEQLHHAYNVHKEILKRVGKSARFDQTLVELGYISSNRLLKIVQTDDRLRRPASSVNRVPQKRQSFFGLLKQMFLAIKYTILPPTDAMDLPLGQMLIQKGLLTEKQLQDALEVQRETSKKIGRSVRLGQILVELGMISSNELIQSFQKEGRYAKSFPADKIKPSLRDSQKAIASKLPSPKIPIWLKIFVALTIIIVATIFTISYVNLNRQKMHLYKQTVDFGTVSLNYIVNSAKIPLIEDNVLRLNEIIKDATSVEGVVYAIIVDQKNTIKAHTDINQIGTEFDDFDDFSAHTALNKSRVTHFDHIMPSGMKVLNISRPIEFQGRRLGHVHVGVSINFIEELIDQERSSIILMTSLLLMGSIIVALFYGVRFTRPISQLVVATQMISDGDYHYKVNMPRKDELGTLAVAFNRMSDELYTKSLVQKAFGKYVGANVLDMIITKPESTWIDGNKSEATIVFIDIRGFSSYFELKEPEDIIKELNKYFEIATKSIREFDGYIDKFIGDAVLGIFGGVKPREGHMEKAVRAALHMKEGFIRESSGGSQLLASIGIGINTGTVFSGSVGSDVRMEYTVIGDSVNVASRLSDLAGPGEIIISKTIYENLKDLIEAEALPPQKIKGKIKPVEVYRVLSLK